MKSDEQEALERLIAVANRDTGQSRRVADFLLAWWNSESCGGFDLTLLWSVDRSIADDMVNVFSWIALNHHYPDTLGYTESFQSIERSWRSTAIR